MILKSGFYGSIAAYALANTAEPIGESFEQTFIPPYDFTANMLRTAFITDEQQKLQGRTGYALGDDGFYVISIRFGPTDLEVIVVGKPQVWNVAKFQKVRTFKAGQPYTIQFFNSHPDAAANYSSVNSLLLKGSLPGLPDGLGCAYVYNGARTVRSGYVPPFSLEDSTKPTSHFGCEWMEVESQFFKLGRTWKQVLPAPMSINTISYRTADGGTFQETYDQPVTLGEVLITNPAVLLRKGTQLPGVAQPWPDPLPGSYAAYSDDDGKTWQKPSLPCDLQFVVQLA